MNADKLARVFSGIQPTGVPHLGNYFGALVEWRRLANERVCQIKVPSKQNYIDDKSNKDNHSTNQNLKLIECDKPIYCIVDIHAYSSPKIEFGTKLYQRILSTTASLLAIGLTPDKCILFRQSDVLEHNYLANVFANFISTQRLTHMTQFKEKLGQLSSNYNEQYFAANDNDNANHDHNTIDHIETTLDKRLGKRSKSFPNGLLTYPILQAADILLYKSTLVPVGEDQLQHIELTRDIARKFNLVTKANVFEEPKGLLNQSSKHARRVKSLRDPEKKMSKSDSDTKAFIELVDEPEVILEKIKKAKTDTISEVYYDIEKRPAVSNLMRIHHLITGETLDQIQINNANIETAQYKLRLADIIIDHLKPIRQEYKRISTDRNYLEAVLKQGHGEAQPLASSTIGQVRQLLGSTGGAGVQ